MKRIVVAVRDRAAACYGSPWFAPTVAMAVRSFVDEVNKNDPSNPAYAHPEDYDLFELGTYDDVTGEFGPVEVTTEVGGEIVVEHLDRPRQICVGKDVARHYQAPKLKAVN